MKSFSSLKFGIDKELQMPSPKFPRQRTSTSYRFNGTIELDIAQNNTRSKNAVTSKTAGLTGAHSWAFSKFVEAAHEPNSIATDVTSLEEG